MDNIRKILETVAKEHPYKIPSWRETYDKYNEGWTDAVNRIESMLPEQTETQCYLGSPCEYQNPNVEIQEERTEKRTETHACDLISRQAAIDAFEKELSAKYNRLELAIGFVGIESILEKLPPAQLEERTKTHAETHACDLISRQAAIDVLQKCRKHCIDPFDSYHIDIQDAENQLSKLPGVQPVATDTNVGDTISRQAAVELVMKYCPDDDGTVQCDGDIRGLLDELENLPSAQPETATVTIGRTKGGVTMWYECDACGEPVDQKDNYCRNCGRKLKHD